VRCGSLALEKYSVRRERYKAPNILEVMGGSVEPRSIFGARFFCPAHVFQNDWSKAYHFGSRQSKGWLAIACVIFELGRLN
jgi:hypothetical protein